MRSGTRHGTASTDPDTHQAESPPKRRRPRRRTVVVLALILGVVGLLALSLTITVREVREDLLRGRSAMERGRAELFAGDAEAASDSFREGRQLFDRAENRTSGVAFRAVGWLPIVGRTRDAITAVADSAGTAADAAIVIADAVAESPGGLSGFAPSDGRIPIDRFPPLARAAADADGLMAAAALRLEEAPTSLLLGPVGPARREAQSELRELSGTIHAASVLLKGLPSFMGAEDPRTYFFGAQNPAELRGTGGVIGAFSILRIDAGRFHFSPFVPIHDLAQPPLKSVPSPNEDYTANYDQFRRGGRFWTSINVMPDFPSVAQAILNSYEAATGTRLDGVILADPFAEAALLEATGPVQLPGYDVEIDADNVVAFTTNEAYSLFTDSVRRKEVLGDVARAAFERFVTQPSADRADLAGFLEAASDRHIQVFSEDPVMQRGLIATPVAGALHPPGADDDLVSVVVNSGAGSKVDFYQERSITYDVELSEDGSASATLGLTLRNEAPVSGQPPYVIGPFRSLGEGAGPILPNLVAGESVALVNVYCGADCVPREARLDGAPVSVGTDVDLGIRYVQHYYSIRSGERRTLRVRWGDPGAWDGNSSGGTYGTTLTNQITIRPSLLSLRIAPPPGMRVVSVSAPLRIEGNSAVYRGEPGPRLDVEIEFGPPLPVRLWRNVTRFLTTPVLEL
jgi:Protein of unknown function (DUF4012)